MATYTLRSVASWEPPSTGRCCTSGLNGAWSIADDINDFRAGCHVVELQSCTKVRLPHPPGLQAASADLRLASQTITVLLRALVSPSFL